ncbi:hypothetical protein [Streptomyces sp. NPDC048242]|uniref:hypothetical protein n=1 Tax=Streptomyces sp. NPDC048242 TaxID=3155026 RepID=UPI0034322DB0
MTAAPPSSPAQRTSDPAAQHRTRFFDHRIPSLYAGRYRIESRQDFRDTDGAQTVQAAPQPFDVVEPRFSIDPTGINACFPPPDADGGYHQTLAHINLDTPGLPWNRPLAGNPDESREVPWMALLIFRENELEEDPDAVGLVTTGTVRELLEGTLGAGVAPDLPDASLRQDEYDEWCATVLVPAQLFDAVKPLPSEMGYLAHLREGGRPDATRASDDPSQPDEGELNGVLVANRFPSAAGGRHVAHVVSLEGFDQYLAEDAPAPAAGVRLVSLTCWSFTSTPESGIGFGDVCQNLATIDGTTPREAEDLLLRVPTSSTAPAGEARQRIEGGAAALPQRLETGERTVAFYRGPLTARPARDLPDPAAVRLDSPGEALIYLQKYGVFDAGYAAAFTAGRTLALADSAFCTALMEFRSSARSAARRLASHPQLAELTGRTARQLTAPLSAEAFDGLLLDGEGGRFTSAVHEAGPRLRAGGRRPAGTRARRTIGDARAVLSQPGVAHLLTRAAPEEFESVQGWLDRLRRLEMLDLSHLVPDNRMLPHESVRFSYVDAGWVRAAVDGALSIGVGHALDADLNQLAAGGGPVPACAVVLHSSLVIDWPHTIVTAYAGERVIEPNRTAIYGTEIQLWLYPEVIDRFELAEPPRGLCFGIGDVGTIELREISGDRIGHRMGEFPPAVPDRSEHFGRFARFLRRGGFDVLNVHGTGDALVPALSVAHDLQPGTYISSAQFALQMINAPQVQSFSRP